MVIEINVNMMAKVKLTEYGKQLLDNYRTNLENKYGYSIEHIFIYNRDGIYETMLWELMNIFGEYMYNGSKQIFENNLIELRE